MPEGAEARIRTVQVVERARHPGPAVVVVPEDEAARLATHRQGVLGVGQHVVLRVGPVHEHEVHGTQVRRVVEGGGIAQELRDPLRLGPPGKARSDRRLGDVRKVRARQGQARVVDAVCGEVEGVDPGIRRAVGGNRQGGAAVEGPDLEAPPGCVPGHQARDHDRLQRGHVAVSRHRLGNAERHIARAQQIRDRDRGDGGDHPLGGESEVPADGVEQRAAAAPEPSHGEEVEAARRGIGVARREDRERADHAPSSSRHASGTVPSMCSIFRRAATPSRSRHASRRPVAKAGWAARSHSAFTGSAARWRLQIRP